MKVQLNPRTLAVCLTSSVLSVCLALTACGGSEAHTVSGLVSADAPVSSVSLKDSSVPPNERTSPADADGAFSFDVNGLTPPFMLTAVDAAGTQLSALAKAAGSTNIDALTTAASFVASDGLEIGDSSERYGSVLGKLRTVLAPLFDHYNVKWGEDVTESRAYRAMLKEVSFTVASGTITVTNKATGGVIFSAPLSDISSGVLHPENIPGATVTPPLPPPPPSACSYTYSAWGACQSSGSQTRTVISSTPAGCTGTPVLSQACVYTPPPPPPPPVIDGAALYTQTCAGCHGPLATSSKRGRTAAQITAAGMTKGLNPAQVQAVADALAIATPPPPPPACTYTTGAWGACQPNGTQTRTVTAAPSGCTGTPPASSQACTYVPPVVACTSFTYSAPTPAVCPSSGQQTRTVVSSAPAGCTGGTPVLTVACTYVPDGAALYAAKCAGCHGPLATSAKAGRTAAQITAASMTQGLSAVEVQAVAAALATVVPPPPPPPPPAASGATLYAQKCSGCHGSLGTSAKAGRTAAQITAASMTQGLSASDVQLVANALSGSALYASKCAGCHGPLDTSAKKGRTAAQITAAGMTQGLTAAQLNDVATALAP